MNDHESGGCIGGAKKTCLGAAGRAGCRSVRDAVRARRSVRGRGRRHCRQPSRPHQDPHAQ